MSEEQLQPIESTRAQKIEETCNTPEEAIRKLMMYIEELEIAIYDKNKEIAERDGRIEELTEKAREYFRKFNSEQLAKRKVESKLKETQDDILILVRQLSVTIRYRESRGK